MVQIVWGQICNFWFLLMQINKLEKELEEKIRYIVILEDFIEKLKALLEMKASHSRVVRSLLSMSSLLDIKLFIMKSQRIQYSLELYKICWYWKYFWK